MHEDLVYEKLNRLYKNNFSIKIPTYDLPSLSIHAKIFVPVRFNSIDGYEFHPIPIDIHLGIIKIPTEEFLNDFGINTTETMIVGTDRKEVLGYLQKHFVMEFRRFDTLVETDSLLSKYEVKKAWTRIRKHIKKYPPN